MEINVFHLSNVSFSIACRGHRVICDQPVENGGADSGMTPPELLLASLGSCAAYYAHDYLQARSLPDEGISVKVTAEKAKAPARLDHFRIAVAVPHLLNERHTTGLKTSVERCLIHNTLLHPPSIQVAVSSGSVSGHTQGAGSELSASEAAVGEGTSSRR
jgi:uncharacterized OsmC-like protein